MIEIIGGEATIQPTIRTSTRHEYDVVAVNTAQPGKILSIFQVGMYL